MRVTKNDVAKMSIEDLHEKKKKLQHIRQSATHQIRELRVTRSEAEREQDIISRELMRRMERNRENLGGA